MKFQKGHKKIEGSGKKRGQKIAKTLAWESIGDYLINEGSDRAKEIMMNSTDKEFMLNFMSLLEYFKPKLARSQHEISNPDGTMRNDIIIVNSEQAKKDLESLG